MGGQNERHTGASPSEPLATGVTFIDIHSALANFARGEESFRPMPEGLSEWRTAVRNVIDPTRYEELSGGYNNLVAADRQGGLTIFWRQSTTRWYEIMRGVLLEHHMSLEFLIPGRSLEDPSKPLTITPEGLLATHTTYIDAETRYPWNDGEIISAAKTMGRLHDALRNVTFDPSITTPSTKENQLLHRDFGRGNVLFQRDNDTVAGVIDYERAAEGPIEQDLGKTLSFLLVDAKIPQADGQRNPSTDDYAQLSEIFSHRLHLWLGNYPDTIDTFEASVWAELYLKNDDYGDLNHVRDMAMRWLHETMLSA